MPKLEGIFPEYKISDIDDASTPQYFGYVDKNGQWYIMEMTSTTVRYAQGIKDYVANWNDRVYLVYDYFNNIRWLSK